LLEAKLPPPLGTGPPLSAAVPAEPTEDALAAELTRREGCSSVRSASSEEVWIDIPIPCKNLEADTPDDKPLRFEITGLQPMKRALFSFEGIHNSHYIGVNELRLLADAKEVPFKVAAADGKGVADIRCIHRGVGGWWAVSGGKHSLLLDLGQEVRLTEVWLLCANGNATPKQLHITKG